MNELTNLINTVGFPITVAVAVGFALYKVMLMILQKVMSVFDTVTEANQELVKTNSILVNKLENKIDIVIEKLDNK